MITMVYRADATACACYIIIVQSILLFYQSYQILCQTSLAQTDITLYLTTIIQCACILSENSIYHSPILFSLLLYR